MPWLGDEEEQGFLPNSIAEIVNRKEGQKRFEVEKKQEKKIYTENPYKNFAHPRVQSVIYENNSVKKIKKENLIKNFQQNIAYKTSQENIFETYMNRGNEEKSIYVALSCFEIAKNYARNEMERTRCFIKIAEQYFLKKDYQEAWSYYNKAKEIHPHDVQVLLGLSKCCLKRGFYALAMEKCKEAKYFSKNYNQEIEELFTEIKNYL